MASAFWLLLAGAGIADGKASVLQTKSYSIKQNGNYAFTPDAGYDGFSSVNVSVAVEAKLQEKSITPTKQEQTVTPDTGFEGLSKIVVGAIPASYIDTSGANATAPDILAPKTAYVNGELVTGTMQEYDGSVTNGTEGMKPQLNTPTISVSGRQLTIYNPSTNGNFTKGYKIFVDGVEKSEQTANTLDLYTYFDEDGTYQLSVAAAAAQFADSNQSAKQSYQRVTPQSDIVWKTTRTLDRDGSYVGSKIGNYALFAIDNASYRTFNAIDNTLTKGDISSWSRTKSGFAGAANKNYAVFAGGASSGYVATADAYDAQLTHTTPPSLSVARNGLVGVSNGNYVLFGGGNSNRDTVDVYDEALTLTQATPLSVAGVYSAGGNTGVYSLFGGLSNDTTVNAYNAELTQIIPDGLSVVHRYCAFAIAGVYALFGGGYNSDVVEAYNSDLTHTIAMPLSKERAQLSGTSLSGYGIFAGGEPSTGVVDVYNEELTRSTALSLTVPRQHSAAVSIGNYAMFAGGYSYSTNIVDVYTVKE